MTIFINNEATQTQKDNLNDLLNEHSFLNIKGIAVALNNAVISKSDWKNTKLNENDKILIITATQGG